MKPGRELDARIAEKIFGCKTKQSPNGDIECGCEPLNLAHEVMWHSWSITPHYSTSIADAWQVVKKLELRNPKIQTGDFVLKSFGPDCWEAEWSDWFEDRGTIFYKASAKTAPHAICLAALKAVDISTANPKKE